ncbi:MAG: ATP phosphoribosyltransferase regulatory subunit [Lachnospiraceae bacterium]|nr:ATP phosphoribosyltransferase regulatory subunit [Lachnospiraceae bacterium]
MNKRLYTTPEGVRDIYDGEAKFKLDLEAELRHKLHLYGFEDIETPTFEYFEVFSEERGSVRVRDLYKFFDRDGNTLVLRPDMTPSIARCAAKYFKEETGPVRFCYCGKTFINNSEYQGKQKETTQLGCELINDPTVTADAEMIAATIDCLLASGLTEFRIDIGDVRFFKALIAETGLDDEKIYELKNYIVDKNSFGLKDFLREENVSEELKTILADLPNQFGGAECLDNIRSLIKNRDALSAVDHLKSLYELMKAYGFEKYVGFDLGMISKYEYYTGIIFHAYTYDVGASIASGGRYDNLVGQFGKDAAAIGMTIITDKLLLALSRQGLIKKSAMETKVFEAKTDAAESIKKAMEARNRGESCIVR